MTSYDPPKKKRGLVDSQSPHPRAWKIVPTPPTEESKAESAREADYIFKKTSRHKRA